uniref:TATA-box binding protein associated factor 7 n=1 Tax=Leptobrachium leishanense TaxID=445787 RepID=A0A8C5PQI9_9ANUR
MTSTKQKTSRSKDDAPHELESQFILRLPQEYASTIRRMVQSGNVNAKDRLSIELHADGRHGIVRVDRVPLAAKLVDIPCVTECLKTIDKKTFYKTADLCQILVCTVDGELYPPLEEPTGTSDPKTNKKKDREKKFVWNHGITPPLKNVRKRRFRKTAKKKYIESPDVEKEVKRLLSTDAEAVSVRWEVIAEDESKEVENLTGMDTSPGMSGIKAGRGSSVERDELREIFNDISSSSDGEEEEEERERQDEEDLNIMETEEEQRGHQDGQDGGTNQIVLELQKQVENLQKKLRETQERRKRQEELIMKVENVALKVTSLQEQLEALIEK